MKTGLVLEGGGLRGVYTDGVLDALEDLGLSFDEYYGISAGSLNAISHLSQQHHRNIDIVLKYIDHPQYMSWKLWFKTGSVFGWEMMFDTIPNHLLPLDYQAYNNNPSKLFAGAYNLEKGETEFFEIKDIKTDLAYLQAGASLPIFSKMVKIGSYHYVDGGIGDSIAIDYALKRECDQIVVVLTRDEDYRKGKDGTLALVKLLYRHYPNLAKQMELRPQEYNAQVQLVNKLAQEGKIVLIRPTKPVTVSRMEADKDKLYNLYQCGYQDTMAKKEELLKYLKRSKINK